MRYNKLVRDKIPEYICKKGGRPRTHVANKTEYWLKLKEKLLEEVEEFNKDENEEELADVLEVLDAIMVYKGFSRNIINTIKRKKAKEKGKFKKWIILDES